MEGGLYSPKIFSMFKRFEVVMGTDINEVEVNEDDTLDLK